jgi:hypothetical protein
MIAIRRLLLALMNCVYESKRVELMNRISFSPQMAEDNVVLASTFYKLITSTRPHIDTVEPRLADTPEKRTSTIMRTPCPVRNAISIDLHTIRTPEMRTPRYSVKRTLGLAPTVSLPIQTHPHSGHFGEKFVDSLVKQIARRAKG